VLLDINKEGTFLLALETLSLLFLSQIVYRDRKTKKKVYFTITAAEKKTAFSLTVVHYSIANLCMIGSMCNEQACAWRIDCA